MKLTEKQKRFCDYYIETGNATEAAIRAGYSKSTAKVIGSENLTKPYLKEYIDERNKLLESDRIADMKEVKEFWTNTMRNVNEETRERLKASELIAKTNGAFLEKVEHSGNINVNNPLEGLTTEELKKLIHDD
ncbi:terminase small subunit [Anaerophilus nitritogenes]|uniref:terminase small subunit n=1 Tax=Anaerophilus nitritogenes TaxID=2498136 RepID=UPI00101BDD37|nr:terminase small subunit [Anaerophilus nitritogenes]